MSDFVPLGEKPVPANIEKIPFVIDRTGNSANLVVRFKDNGGDLVLGKIPTRRQARRTSPDDYGSLFHFSTDCNRSQGLKWQLNGHLGAKQRLAGLQPYESKEETLWFSGMRLVV